MARVSTRSRDTAARARASSARTAQVRQSKGTGIMFGYGNEGGGKGRDMDGERRGGTRRT